MPIDWRRATAWLTAAGFVLGSLAHFAGLVLFAFGVRWYGPHYPAWRHAAMASVDVSVAAVALIRPGWLIWVLPIFLCEQVFLNGFGATSAFVGAALAAVLIGRRRRHLG